MSAIQIRKAKREGARLVIMLCGPSGSGKTRTALEIALGLAAHNPAAIGFLDTENRRGSLYADVFADPDRLDRTDEEFLIADLFAPHSPDRYIESIQIFQRAGVKVLVIDSGSHEWEGIGGCIEIAEGSNPNKPNWAKGKREHKKFMNALLTCDMHVILCLRAREKAKPEMQKVHGVDKLVYVPLGMQPIAEQNVLYEATASLMLYDEGLRQEVIKCPGPLVPFLARGEGYITAADGDQVRRWVEGGCLAVQMSRCGACTRCCPTWARPVAFRWRPWPLPGSCATPPGLGPSRGRAAWPPCKRPWPRWT